MKEIIKIVENNEMLQEIIKSFWKWDWKLKCKIEECRKKRNLVCWITFIIKFESSWIKISLI